MRQPYIELRREACDLHDFEPPLPHAVGKHTACNQAQSQAGGDELKLHLAAMHVCFDAQSVTGRLDRMLQRRSIAASFGVQRAVGVIDLRAHADGPGLRVELIVDGKDRAVARVTRGHKSGLLNDIVFYPQYFVQFHGVLEDWFKHGLGVDYARFIRTEKLGIPTVHIQADFVAPSKHGETLRFALEIREIGRSSIKLGLMAAVRQ